LCREDAPAPAAAGARQLPAVPEPASAPPQHATLSAKIDAVHKYIAVLEKSIAAGYDEKEACASELAKQHKRLRVLMGKMLDDMLDDDSQ
jgi:hypothetical protein